MKINIKKILTKIIRIIPWSLVGSIILATIVAFVAKFFKAEEPMLWWFGTIALIIAFVWIKEAWQWFKK